MITRIVYRSKHIGDGANPMSCQGGGVFEGTRRGNLCVTVGENSGPLVNEQEFVISKNKTHYSMCTLKCRTLEIPDQRK